MTSIANKSGVRRTWEIIAKTLCKYMSITDDQWSTSMRNYNIWCVIKLEGVVWSNKRKRNA